MVMQCPPCLQNRHHYAKWLNWWRSQRCFGLTFKDQGLTARSTSSGSIVFSQFEHHRSGLFAWPGSQDSFGVLRGPARKVFLCTRLQVRTAACTGIVILILSCTRRLVETSIRRVLCWKQQVYGCIAFSRRRQSCDCHIAPYWWPKCFSRATQLLQNYLSWDFRLSRAITLGGQNVKIGFILCLHMVLINYTILGGTSRRKDFECWPELQIV